MVQNVIVGEESGAGIYVKYSLLYQIGEDSVKVTGGMTLEV